MPRRATPERPSGDFPPVLPRDALPVEPPSRLDLDEALATAEYVVNYGEIFCRAFVSGSPDGRGGLLTLGDVCVERDGGYNVYVSTRDRRRRDGWRRVPVFRAYPPGPLINPNSSWYRFNSERQRRVAVAFQARLAGDQQRQPYDPPGEALVARRLAEVRRTVSDFLGYDPLDGYNPADRDSRAGHDPERLVGHDFEPPARRPIDPESPTSGH